MKDAFWCLKFFWGLELKQYAVNNISHPVLGRTNVRVM